MPDSPRWITRQLQSLTRLEPLATPATAARAYVPVVLINRGLAMVRLLLVTWLLGSAGKTVFGQYQLALEAVNWLAAVALFGLADVAERYAAHHEHAGDLGPFLRRQLVRLLTTAGALGLLLSAAAPKLGDPLVVIAVALNLIALAPYQWLAGVLRGLRAYSAAAGMESVAAILAAIFAALAAWQGTSAALLLAYFAANALAFLFYALKLKRYVKATSNVQPPTPNESPPNRDRFARWALLRLLLTMSFGLVALWSVKFLAQRVPGISDHGNAAAADFAMPYRVAQLLAYAAITLWASNYGLASTNWVHGRRRRAMVELLRIGKRGGVALLLIATALAFFRDYIALLVPGTYANAINLFLPALLGIFFWYGMLTFLVTFGDLQERPWVGALLWASVLVTQLATIVTTPITSILDAQWTAIHAASLGFGLACMFIAPAFLWRPARMTATSVPIGLLLFCAIAFFCPPWVVDYILPVVTGLLTLFLWITGLLLR